LRCDGRNEIGISERKSRQNEGRYLHGRYCATILQQVRWWRQMRFNERSRIGTEMSFYIAAGISCYIGAPSPRSALRARFPTCESHMLHHRALLRYSSSWILLRECCRMQRRMIFSARFTSLSFLTEARSARVHHSRVRSVSFAACSEGDQGEVIESNRPTGEPAKPAHSHSLLSIFISAQISVFSRDYTRDRDRH